jgi:signal transduction histidine kinase
MSRRPFRDFSIRAKLLWIVMLTSSIALIAAGIAIVAYDSITFTQQKQNDLATQAAILAATSSAALEFNDTKAAKEYLAALKARPEVASAVMYDDKGKIFASYHRSDSARNDLGAKVDLPRVEAEGSRIEGDDLLLFRQIKQGNKAIGTLYLRANLDRGARLLSYAGIVLIVLLGSLLIAFLLSAKLQALISQPLLAVTKVAHEVIDKQNYSHRVVKRGDDEVGVLVDAFNQMLTQIQEREATLQATNMTLRSQITRHKAARDEIAALNLNLEKRVAERTAALEASNKELESFSYSVSHDLRAPLRGIDGFATFLQIDYADKLDAQGKSYLQRVRAATRRMSNLIDDLLKLSRTTRSELRPRQVNLSELADTIAKDLQRTGPGRNATFTIAPDMMVEADPALLQVALENLMGNAWKFTGKRAEARIEVGRMAANGGSIAYFVRDNGAGFDMKYVDKLFGAFQRLHAITEFDGTGVGLANVQRIIARHGGKVWAEGVVDQGATFYFTLST